MPRIPRRKPGPIRRHRTLVIAACALLALAFFFLFAGHLLASAEDPPSPADLICILGGGRGERAARGVELYRQGIAPRLLFCGMPGYAGREEHCYEDLRVRRALDAGVPREAIFFDTLSTTSWEEARTTRNLMKKYDWKRVVVVSDPPHLRRLAWTWGKWFNGSSRSFSLTASRPEWWNPDRWWENRRSREFVLSELGKIAYYWVRY